jgi:hypothetical protein
MGDRQTLSVEDASELLRDASWFNTLPGDVHEGHFMVWARLNDTVAAQPLDGAEDLLQTAKSIWREYDWRGHDLAVLDDRNRLFRYYVRK